MDNAFYSDGATLVMRDFSRRGYLLLPQLYPSLKNAARNEQGGILASGSMYEEEKRQQLQRDVWSLFWFSFLAMNTFPLTPAVVTWLLKNAPWLPRHWILPSQFEQERLDQFRRVRDLYQEGQIQSDQGEVLDRTSDKMRDAPSIRNE